MSFPGLFYLLLLSLDDDDSFDDFDLEEEDFDTAGSDLLSDELLT
jgi:hypothetical protein